jgi:hypothetical protein
MSNAIDTQRGDRKNAFERKKEVHFLRRTFASCRLENFSPRWGKI